LGVHGHHQPQARTRPLDQRRERGDSHAAALRHLFNRLIGQLHHCLQTNQLYDQDKAFDAPEPAAA
jgi:hypothetical protein